MLNRLRSSKLWETSQHEVRAFICSRLDVITIVRSSRQPAADANRLWLYSRSGTQLPAIRCLCLCYYLFTSLTRWCVSRLFSLAIPFTVPVARGVYDVTPLSYAILICGGHIWFGSSAAINLVEDVAISVRAGTSLYYRASRGDRQSVQIPGPSASSRIWGGLVPPEPVAFGLQSVGGSRDVPSRPDTRDRRQAGVSKTASGFPLFVHEFLTSHFLIETCISGFVRPIGHLDCKGGVPPMPRDRYQGPQDRGMYVIRARLPSFYLMSYYQAFGNLILCDLWSGLAGGYPRSHGGP